MSLILLLLNVVVFIRTFEQWKCLTEYYESSDYFYSVSETPDGGFITCGQLASGNDFEVVKYGSDGSFLWGKRIGEEGTGAYEQTYSVAVNQTTGDIFLAGMRGTGMPFSVFLLKLNSDGGAVKSVVFGGTEDDRASKITTTSTGGVIVTGKTKSCCEGTSSDVFVAKFDENLELDWIHSFGGGASTDSDEGLGVQETNDGGVIIAGYIKFSNGFVVKLDSDGLKVWARSASSRVYSARQVLGSGPTGYVFSASGGSYDMLFGKMDENGDLLWCSDVKMVESGIYEYDVSPTPDGGLISAGTYYGRAYLSKVNHTGGLEWFAYIGVDITAGGAGSDSIEEKSYIRTEEGYVITGHSSYLSDSMKAFISFLSVDSVVSGDPRGGCGWDDFPASAYSTPSCSIDGLGWANFDVSVATNTGDSFTFSYDSFTIAESPLSASNNEIIKISCREGYSGNETYCSECRNTSICGCDENYYGSLCDITTCYGIFTNDSSLSSSQCSGNGKCEFFNRCECFSEYYGETCNVTTCFGIFSNSTVTDQEEEEMVCNAHGICESYDYCFCDVLSDDVRYDGLNCSILVDNTDPVVYSGGLFQKFAHWMIGYFFFVI